MAVETPCRDSLDLSVVIPACDERADLNGVLVAVAEVLRAMEVAAEIIVAGRPSRGTMHAATACGARVILLPDAGYGAALRAGFAAAAADYVATIDAAVSHSPDCLRVLWARRREADVLIASRYGADGTDEATEHERRAIRVRSRIVRAVLSIAIGELSSGFRLYRRAVLNGLKLSARDDWVLEEILVRAQAEGWRILEVPLHPRERRPEEARRRPVRIGWAHLRALWRLWQLRNSIEAADYDFRAFDSRIWLQRYWQRTRQRIVLDFLDQRDSVLDVGCGSSRIVVTLPKAVGFDLAQRKLRWLRPHHEPLVRGAGEHLPFADGTFDTVICSEVIEHVVDPSRLLRELDRVLRPGGTLILGTPDYGRWSWRVLERVYGIVAPGGYAREHISPFTRRTMVQQLNELAYSVLACHYVGFSEMIFKARKPAALHDRDGQPLRPHPRPPTPLRDGSDTARPKTAAAVHDEIVRTTILPHYFQSAFTRTQVHRYLRAKLGRGAFDGAVEQLIRSGNLLEKDGCLYACAVPGVRERAWSRELFIRQRVHLRLLSRLPSVRFMGLTGANAFESCRPQDDVDLFVVTARDRLWLTFIAMIVWSRLVGRRDLLCINYLLDEDHLHIQNPSYYTAVQLMSMLPLVDRGISAALVEANPWVFDYLPNAEPVLEHDPFYALETPRAGDRTRQPWPLLATANRRLYRAYAERLRGKYPEAFGKGIVVGEGVAKLHPVDYGDLYERIERQALPEAGHDGTMTDVGPRQLCAK